MSTLNDVVQDVRDLVLGMGGESENLTYLTGSLNASATSFVVGNAADVKRGLIEIDSELMWVDSVNTGTNTVTLAPFGRGYRGTTAATHSANAKVSINPVLPTARVRQAINDTLNAVGGDLFGVASATLASDSGIVTYELTTGSFPNVLDVLSVTVDAENASEVWMPVRRWKFLPSAPTSAFPSGKALDVYEPVVDGSLFNITFTRNPATFSPTATGSEDFTTVTFLPESCRDVIAYGAAARLAWGLEGGRTNNYGVTADAVADVVPGGGRTASGSALARQLYAFHQQRVQEERAQLLRNIGPTVHYQR